jgi:twitching motility protein PilT
VVAEKGFPVETLPERKGKVAMNIEELFRIAEERKASDLHMVVSCRPLLRIDGSLRALEENNVLTTDDLNEIFIQVTTQEQRDLFYENRELDFSYKIPWGGYSRCNACLQQGALSLAFRLQPSTIPKIEELGLPKICMDLIVRPRGLVVVSGPTGSGKSTTLASMLQYLNDTEYRYVVTIEDPIEYRYTSNKCSFSQRELAADTFSFTNALKHVLRQDPDVILVGEMRDLETVSAVLTLAETGHLILSTGHAPSAAQTVERIVDLFPPHERDSAQSRLASVLLGVLSQALVPRIAGGRVAAIEIMLANPAVKNLIREGKTHLLSNSIRTGGQIGMQTLDGALITLFRQRLVSWDSVLAYCQDKGEVEKLAAEMRV